MTSFLIGGMPLLDTSYNETPTSTEALTKSALHETWDALLKKHVTNMGKVNYAAIRENTKPLNDYLNLLAENEPASNWDQNRKLAYWINLYNASTVKLIVDNYPISSITKLDKPWDKPFIRVGDQVLTLNQVEHEIIRKRFDEPRIHFAVNCAAKSCPPLLNQAYKGETLGNQLDRVTRNFIRSANNDIQKDAVRLSKIFEWYGSDFGDLVKFLNRYVNPPIAEGTSISFMEYDWSLNKQ
ncbi:MAG: DUF547 domain-containing protein [Bacteroidota bacterium]